jgi:hypothetical protein
MELLVLIDKNKDVPWTSRSKICSANMLLKWLLLVKLFNKKIKLSSFISIMYRCLT